MEQYNISSDLLNAYFELLSNLDSVYIPVRPTPHTLSLTDEDLYQIRQIRTSEEDIVCQALYRCDVRFRSTYNSATNVPKQNTTELRIQQKMSCATQSISHWTCAQRVSTCTPLTCFECMKPLRSQHDCQNVTRWCKQHLGYYVCGSCATKPWSCPVCGNRKGILLNMIVQRPGIGVCKLPGLLKFHVPDAKKSPVVVFRTNMSKGKLILFSHPGSVVGKRVLNTRDRLLNVTSGQFIKPIPNAIKNLWIFSLPFSSRPNCKLSLHKSGRLLQLQVLCPSVKNEKLRIPLSSGRRQCPAKTFPFNVDLGPAGPLIHTAKSGNPKASLRKYLNSLNDSNFVRLAARCEVVVQSKPSPLAPLANHHVHWLANAALNIILTEASAAALEGSKLYDALATLVQTVQTLQVLLPQSGAQTACVFPNPTPNKHGKQFEQFDSLLTLLNLSGRLGDTAHVTGTSPQL